jgi:murein DD-endopeptidase MepM/ murein hydrolase activator NlpD
MPDVARHAVERHFVLRSALRILSLLTVLGLVAGVVVLTQQPGAADPSAALTVQGTAGARASAVLDGAASRDAAALTHQVTSAQEARRRAAAAQAAAARAKAEAARKAAVAARAEAKARATRAAVRDPKAIARIMARDRGWGGGQFSCLRQLWQRESNWNHRAMNPSSGAYGIPQSLPGGKMASAGSDWRTNPITQIEWGLDYIADRYGTPCGAWAHSESHNWY